MNMGIQRYFRETPHLSVTPVDALWRDKENDLFLQWNAAKIQAWWKSRVCKQRFMKMKQAALVLQRYWIQVYKSLLYKRLLSISASRIQRCWKSFRNRKIFRYYRDLITDNEKLHPSLLLRRINPSEAALADTATGLHIRFRLGGTTFPPSLLYKLYTHRPVVDMGAFSPRKYSVSLRRPVSRGPFCPKRCFQHPLRRNKDEYVRCENNGWRLVCDTAWMHNVEEAIPDYKEPTKVFYPSVTARREHKAQESRRKKREWLNKLYNDGRAAEVSAATVTTTNSKSIGTDDDFRAIELFLWSLGLNFESYESDWSNLATSCVKPSYEFHQLKELTL